MAEELSQEERRAKRERKMKAAYEDFVGKVRADRNRLFFVCPAPKEPAQEGRMNEQVGNEAFYFLAILEFRSGIPQFDPTIRETVQTLRPADWGNGNHSMVREAREIIRRNPEPKDFIPTMRQMGVLVHVMNVWDKSLTRMVMVDDQMKERKGDWKVRYRFSRHTTPLRAGIDSRSWFHYERPAKVGAAAHHVHHGVEGYVMSPETAQRSAEIKARLAAGHIDEEEEEEIAIIDNRDAHKRPPYPWETSYAH